jgi:hypothetical protein
LHRSPIVGVQFACAYSRVMVAPQVRPPAPPRPPGAGGPPRPPGASGQPLPPGAGRPGGGGRTVSFNSPSTGQVLGLFILNALFSAGAVLSIPLPPKFVDLTFSNWFGFVLGLFGCTFSFGLMRLFVARQRGAGTFSDWSIPLSKITAAKFFTLLGWIAGSVHCYLIANYFARNIS